MWFRGTTDYCTIHLDNFWERQENEIASNHSGRCEKVIHQKLQQITQPKHAMVLDDLDPSLLNKGITKYLSQSR